jgi:putative endonuclease
MEKADWVYILANRAFGTLYIGVTGDLDRRLSEHRAPDARGFAAKYRATRLVYAERHDSIDAAIRRETSMKRWRRSWKVDLVMSANPEWRDIWSE